ncbi:hypothetical protein ACIOJE_37285 [Kitasatospora sp. NPDC087861]|uniref:hypothetical protein n=1 Tax=Kitasatospora sp. NPDC087861 TaxID=3364070 RepID=UPI00381B7D98
MDWEGIVEEPQGSLTALDGRLLLDPDTRIATVDGREVHLTRQDTRVLRALIELGEGVHDPLDIIERVWGCWPDPRELRVPMAVLTFKLGEPSWIERTEDGYGLRAPERP